MLSQTESPVSIQPGKSATVLALETVRALLPVLEMAHRDAEADLDVIEALTPIVCELLAQAEADSRLWASNYAKGAGCPE